MGQASLKAVQLVIFDLDGTLMNAYRAVWESINYALAKTGFPPQSHTTIKRSVGWGDRHLLERFVGRRALPKVLRIYRRHHLESLQTGTTLLPGALKVLRTLQRRGYTLAVASNRPSRFSRIALEVLGISSYFAQVICADQVKRGKPWPDMFKVILRRQKKTAAQALYVGDMMIDVQAGQRANMKTVVVLTGSCTRADVLPFGPTKIIRRIDQLLPFLPGLV